MRISRRTFLWLVVVVAIGAAARAWLIDVEEVPNNEMAPTLLLGDRIVLLTPATVRRGDVVLCNHPQVPGRRVWGRVFGMPGDTVAIQRGVPIINGDRVGTEVPTPPSYVLNDALTSRTYRLGIREETMGSGSGATYHVSMHSSSARMEMAPRRVRSGYFLIADNRKTMAIDSRIFGEVNPVFCSGVAIVVLWPGAGQGPTAPGERRFDMIR
ncbi:MAG: signal peptidase I [Deltaproteobacteria bacterium]|nr:signal peptidase I [Deltaproteobacteria bacterium]